MSDVAGEFLAGLAKNDDLVTLMRKWAEAARLLAEDLDRFADRYREQLDRALKAEAALSASQEENTRLRAALANSPGACVYCQLPKDEWAKCRSGFPGCARADDAAGCPEYGAAATLHFMREDLSASQAENEKLRAWAEDEQRGRHKAEEDRMNLRSENERVREALKAARPYVPSQQWRHKKRGSVYTVVGVAEVQAEVPLTEAELVVVYRGEKDGRFWVRRKAEFLDGRFERLDDAPPREQEPLRANNLHPDTATLVRDFANALTNKLKRAEEKYGYDNGWLTQEWEDECRQHLLDHIRKGDPLDVAAYCTFMWARGWSTAGSPREPQSRTDYSKMSVLDKSKAAMGEYCDPPPAPAPEIEAALASAPPRKTLKEDYDSAAIREASARLLPAAMKGLADAARARDPSPAPAGMEDRPIAGSYDHARARIVVVEEVARKMMAALMATNEWFTNEPAYASRSLRNVIREALAAARRAGITEG